MGFEVAKADIRMPTGHLKQIGDYPIVVALHHDAIANITVTVLGES
jgi:large subunit ribosomal protein L9